jgi:hypothetical protein
MKIQSLRLKKALVFGAKCYARSVVWLPGPKIFINSIPKAGTHLLTSVIPNLPSVMPSYMHVRMPDVGAFIYEQTGRSFACDITKVDKKLRYLRNGQFFSGHFYYDSEFENYLNQNQYKMIFLVRDPRAIVVSKIKYIMDLPRHPMHDFFKHELRNDQDRVIACIQGIKNVGQKRSANLTQLSNDFIGLKEILSLQKGWMFSDDVMTLKYENLRGTSDGGNDLVRDNQFYELFNFIGRPRNHDQICDILDNQNPNKSPTFSAGKVDGWKKFLSPSLLSYCDSELGELISEYGY